MRPASTTTPSTSPSGELGLLRPWASSPTVVQRPHRWGRIRDIRRQHAVRSQLQIEYADGSAETVVTDKTGRRDRPDPRRRFPQGELRPRKEMPAGARGLQTTPLEAGHVTDKIRPGSSPIPGSQSAVQEIKNGGLATAKDGAWIYEWAQLRRLRPPQVRDASGKKMSCGSLSGSIRRHVLHDEPRGARAIRHFLGKGGGTEAAAPIPSTASSTRADGYSGKPYLDDSPHRLTSADHGGRRLRLFGPGWPKRSITTCAKTLRPTSSTSRPTARSATCGSLDGRRPDYDAPRHSNTDVASSSRSGGGRHDAQLPNGAFTDVSPRKVATGGGTAAWGDAGVICQGPSTRSTAPPDPARHYAAMERWIEYCKGSTKERCSAGEGRRR
jgi:hypothetical protein